MNSIEVRSIPTERLEIRKTADGRRTLVGVVAPFNSLSVNLGGFRERIQPGAFSSNLMSKPDVRLVADHDLSVSKLLARTASGTMRLREDSNAGLLLEADLPNTAFADDVVESINRGDLSGLSMSFNADDDDWAQDANGDVIRTLRAVTLGPEISLVVAPAYRAATVNLRSCPIELRSFLMGEDDDLLAVILAKRRIQF